MSRKKPKVSVLNHLPHKIRKAIILIRDLIIEKYHPEMLILFGSYADRIAWHRHSDIDMLIVAETDDRPLLELKIQQYILDNVPKKTVARVFSPIVETPERLNEQLAIGQYFFKEIVEKGKILYDTGRFSLAEMRLLTNKEYKELVTKDFIYWREEAEGFFKGHYFYISDENFRLAAFNLHQTCESCFKMIELIFTRYASKTHDLNMLLDICLPHLPELKNIFPKDTEFKEQAYSRLRHAYLGARYDQKYEIEKDELDYLGERVKLFLELAIKRCRERTDSLPQDDELREELV
jgi:HEPN domain-containing protein/predicted nucleotidyltransferase